MAPFKNEMITITFWNCNFWGKKVQLCSYHAIKKYVLKFPFSNFLFWRNVKICSTLTEPSSVESAAKPRVGTQHSLWRFDCLMFKSCAIDIWITINFQHFIFCSCVGTQNEHNNIAAMRTTTQVACIQEARLSNIYLSVQTAPHSG